MYDIMIGNLRLNVRSDGTGVVVRTGVLFNGHQPRVPLEPADAENQVKLRATFRIACLVCLGVSALCLVGAVSLLMIGWVVPGIALGAVGLVHMALGLIFLVLWGYRPDRGQLVVTDPAQVEQFRLAVEAEQQTPGKSG